MSGGREHLMRILVIEDEKKMAGFISRGLQEEHFAVDVAPDGERGLEMAELNPYDLVILDIMLPDTDGISLCRELRRKKMNFPILLLTARSHVKDKVTGLNAGADDYLTKPFAFEELLARINALIRREKRSGPTSLLKVADLELDQTSHKVHRAGKPIDLTSREYSLLEYLMLHTGHIVTRTMITEHVWNANFDTFTNVIDVYINYLRNKIDKDSGRPLIHTIRGTGYILEDKTID